MTAMQREPLIPHDPAQSLLAGGIVALKAKLPATDEMRTTSITARTYGHPALDAKVIVRLEPDAVAEGTDAEMAAFGFTAPKVSPALGNVRYRTLGFPAWGLVNAPKTAKVALGVMEDVRKAKRMVAAKPGHAKEAFEKIAKTLQKASPMLLPSFWEEVGRTVADLASATMAAQCFERARQAERAFKLKIDADDSDAVFVEFALLGALSAKTLSQYAKDLAKSEGGAQAYRRFRSIAVKRALGGMPPWSGMGKDIRSLAKAAELDLETEDESLVAELLEAPAIGKAPTEFWTTYRDAMIRLARANPAVRARLRALWPDPRGGTRENRDVFRKGWIEILDEVGALADLPDDGLGAWVSRLLNYAGMTERITALLRELAPRLKSQPIAVVTPRSRWGTDLNLDLAELALELGIPLADPKSDDFYPESMTCDPVRVAAHETYGKKLVEAVASMIGESEHEHRMRGKRGFETARRAWIDEQLGKLATHPVSCTSTELDTIEGKTTADTFLPFQELWAKLRATEFAEPLALQLRAGIADEFGWPAYELAVATLDGPYQVGGAFPILVAYTATKAIAIDHTGVIAEHDLVYKTKEHKVDDVVYVDGQFYVVLDPVKGWGSVAYWSGNPKQRFEPKDAISSNVVATTLPDGRVTMSGNKAFRAGDTTMSGTDSYFTDGTKFWRFDYRDAKGQLRELDPTKDTKLGMGLPDFFARPWPTPQPEPRPDWYHSELHAAPAGLTSSPLGIANGLLGQRVRRLSREEDDANNIQYERIDGLVHEDTGGYSALVKFPGATVLKPIDAEQVSNPRFPGGNGNGIELWDGGHSVKLNEQDWASRGWGTTHVPPVLFWHYLTPRDEAGSKALRAVTTAQASAILAAARKELAGEPPPGGGGRAMPQTEAVVKQTLGISDAKLARGVVGIAEHAAELALRLDAIAAERAKENADPGGEGLTKEGMQLRKMCAALIAGRPTKIADFEIDPRDWLSDGRLSALKSLSPIADDDDRRKARDMMRALADSPLADEVSKIRTFTINEPDDWSDPEDWNTLVIKKQDASAFALHGSDNWGIEYTTDGTFRVPSPWTIEDEKKLEVGVGKEWARAFLALPDERPAWDPAIATTLAERAGLSVPEATLLYLGMPSGWSKDFLGKQKRELVGLKMGEADAARTTFQELDEKKKHDLLAKAVPDDAALLATPLADGGYVDRLAKVWKQKFGKRAKVPQDLIAAAKKDLALGNELAKYLPAFAGEDDVWFLRPDLRPFHELGGWGDDKGLTWNTGSELATLIAWLFVQRPVGDPIRNGLATVVDGLVKVVNDPRVIWKFDDRYTGDEPKDVTYRESLFQLVGGKAIELPKDDDDACTLARDDGAIVIAQYGTRIATGFRPAKLEGAARKKIETLAKAVFDPEDGSGEAELKEVKVADLLRSEGFAAFAERVRDTPVATGKFEANPAASVPKLVTKVAKATGLSAEAAALYLQVLALAEPTERAVQMFNGWTAKQYKAAAAELAKKKLVVEGKRERAGRGIFLKGGYSKGDRKDLPMEDWKQPFYGTLERHVPAEPCHVLFARAWKRVEDGDKPT